MKEEQTNTIRCTQCNKLQDVNPKNKNETRCIACKKKGYPHKCEVCGKPFYSQQKEMPTCSRTCANQLNAPARPCKRCGKDYYSNSTNRLFCSDECGHEFRKVNKPCAHCGNAFRADKLAKYCSKECRERGEHIFILECAVCDKEFEAKSATYKYCSDKCRKAGQSQNKTIHVCKHCKTQFLTNKALKHTKQYCSDECRKQYRNIIRKKAVCKQCKKQIHRTLLINDEFCSLECYNLHRDSSVKTTKPRTHKSPKKHIGHCVYSWSLPNRRYVPFYIGRGGPDERPYYNHKGKCEEWTNKHADVIIDIVVDGLTEQGAKLVERVLIQVYRKLGGCEANIQHGSDTIGYPPLTIWGDLV